MAGPSETWTDISIDQWTTKTPLRASLVDAWRTNQEHLKEVAYGTSISYGGGSGHTHDGTDSSAQAVNDSSNLLLSAFYFGDYYTGPFSGYSSLWSKTFAVASFGGHAFITSGIAYGQASGVYASQIIGGTATKSLGLFGTNGADLVISVWARSHDSDSIVGELEFGLGDGSNSPVSATTATVTASDLSLQWKRFYARFSGAGAGHSTDVRFVVRVSTSFSPGKVAVCGAMVTQGDTLAPAMISNLEVIKIPNFRFGWLPDAPIFERQISMADAVDVTP